MKRAIYVDYENVSLSGLKDVESLGTDDVVKIFIGAQNSKLSMVDANRIFNCEASVELITNKYIGKNALDFIIMVHMGHDIALSLAKEYYIISKDKGYDPAIHEMRRLSGLSVRRCEDITATLEKKTGIGSKIKGFFKSHKNSEEPDTTEHVVVGKKNNSSLPQTKKDVKIEASPKQAVKDEKAVESAKKKHPEKTVNKSNEAAGKQNNKKPVNSKPADGKPKEKAIEKQAEQVPVEKTGENVQVSGDEAVKKMGNHRNRNHHRNRHKNNGAENKAESAEVKSTEETLEVKDIKENKPAKSQKNEESTKVEQQNDMAPSAQDESKSLEESQSTLEAAGEKKNNHNHRNRRGRGHYHNNRRSANNHPEGAGENVKSSASDADQSLDTNVNKKDNSNGDKKQSAPKETVKDEPVVKEAKKEIPKMSKEEEERERARREAFALLSELDEQERNEVKPVYVRKK